MLEQSFGHRSGNLPCLEQSFGHRSGRGVGRGVLVRASFGHGGGAGGSRSGIVRASFGRCPGGLSSALDGILSFSSNNLPFWVFSDHFFCQNPALSIF